MFSATGLGIVISVLKDAKAVDSEFGQLDAGALFGSASTLARVPLFLAILLAVRGLPALLYRPLLTARETAASGLLQATSVGFFVVATEIGQEMGLIGAGTSAALIAAGLLSVFLFPLGSLMLLSAGEAPAAEGLEELPLGVGR